MANISTQTINTHKTAHGCIAIGHVAASIRKDCLGNQDKKRLDVSE